MQISASCLKFLILSLNVKMGNLEGSFIVLTKYNPLSITQHSVHIALLTLINLHTQIHTKLSYYYPNFTRKKSERETYPSEFSNINSWDLTLEIFILALSLFVLNLPPRLSSLSENGNAGFHLVALSHRQIP